MSESRLTSKTRSMLEKLQKEVEEKALQQKEDELIRTTREEILRKVPVHRRPHLDGLIQFLNEDVKKMEKDVIFRDVGTVQQIGNGVATLSGLPHMRTDGLVEFTTGVRGLVLNLNHSYLDVILLGSSDGISGGDLVKSVGERLKVPVGPKVIGRILNPLGDPLDEQGRVTAADYWVLDRRAPGVVERSPVNEPLHTGTKMVDALLPIGRGQRELIIGDRQTGKTSVAVDAILSQKDSDVDCIYVAIGQKKSSTLAVIETLREAGAFKYTTVVMSSPDDPPALRYLAPYSGVTMAEYLLEMGRNVLIVFDDLSKHADAYRELSLLLRRPPGREAYPGDIFYLHSRLLERACRLNDDYGGGSITALPIVSTQRGNISAYIPTNLISITDGQIVLDADQFNRGIKPAVDVGKSVSRVGGAAQTKVMRNLSGDLRLQLAQYEEVARFARFGTDVDPATRRQIETGQRLQTVLMQTVHQPLSLGEEIITLYAAVHGYLNQIAIEDIPGFERALHQYFEENQPQIELEINDQGALTPKLKEQLRHTIESFCEFWLEGKGATE
ncbi:MAG: F0F1 ATP synthase subunit alpha [Anaerolineaceae bacterium]|nr:F0F1 ATP synthase subunit alpha [Anaerolineaceae bacterium]